MLSDTNLIAKLHMRTSMIDDALLQCTQKISHCFVNKLLFKLYTVEWFGQWMRPT